MRGKVVLNAELSGDFFANRGMVAAPAFGYVMKQAGKIQQFRFCNQQKNIIAERQFIKMFF